MSRSTLARRRARRALDPEVQRRRREHEAERERLRRRDYAEYQAALAKGEEPLPGERTGTAGGSSRLNEAYWQRQQKLKDDVERARVGLEKARAQQR